MPNNIKNIKGEFKELKSQRWLNKHKLELRWKSIGILSPKFKSLEIDPLADAHFGNPYFSQHHFDKALARLEIPNVYTVLMGDLLECVLKNSKGDVYGQTASPQDQRDWIIKQLYPYRHKILGMCAGNHERRIFQETGIDVCKDIANALDVPYRNEGILLKVMFGDNCNRTKGQPYTYFIYATHGYGGARTKSAKAVKVERLATWIDADVYIMAHDHVVNLAPDVYLKPDPRGMIDDDGFLSGAIIAKEKILVKTNAYLKWGGYSEAGGFPPVNLNPVTIILNGTGKPQARAIV